MAKRRKSEPSSAADRLVKLLASVPHENQHESVDPSVLTPTQRLAWLTLREREVLQLYVDCQNAKEIAQHLGSRPQTVKNQLTSIEHKLGVDSREGLLVYLMSLVVH